MRLPLYIVQHHNGLAFRIVVPRDLRAVLGRASFKRTLPTSDRRVAIAWALALSSAYTDFFAKVRRGQHTMTNKTLEELLHSATGAMQPVGRGQQWEMSISPTGEINIKTDGTDADHRNALEAYATVARTPVSVVPVQSVPPAPQTAVSLLTGVPVGVTVIGLGKAIEAYIPLKSKSLTVKEQGKLKKVLGEFREWIGKDTTPVHTLQPNDVGNFYATELNKGLTKTYVANKISVLSGFFKWAGTNSYYPKGLNPTSGHVEFTKHEKLKKIASGWQEFSVDRLKAIFNVETYVSMREDESRWLPLLLLYTGARSNEIARLELEDIKQVQERWVFSINIIGEDKSLKTSESVRDVPIHNDLMRLGFLDKVSALRMAGETKLFPNLSFDAQNGPANAPQRAFSRYLSRIKIEARGNGIVGLHSLRNTVITTLDEASVELNTRQRYAGHKDGEQVTTETVSVLLYSKNAKYLNNLASACHPPLNWIEKEVIDLEAFRKILK